MNIFCVGERRSANGELSNTQSDDEAVESAASERYCRAESSIGADRNNLCSGCVNFIPFLREAASMYREVCWLVKPSGGSGSFDDSMGPMLVPAQVVGHSIYADG